MGWGSGGLPLRAACATLGAPACRGWFRRAAAGSHVPLMVRACHRGFPPCTPEPFSDGLPGGGGALPQEIRREWAPSCNLGTRIGRFGRAELPPLAGDRPKKVPMWNLGTRASPNGFPCIRAGRSPTTRQPDEVEARAGATERPGPVLIGSRPEPGHRTRVGAKDESARTSSDARRSARAQAAGSPPQGCSDRLTRLPSPPQRGPRRLRLRAPPPPGPEPATPAGPASPRPRRSANRPAPPAGPASAARHPPRRPGWR